MEPHRLLAFWMPSLWELLILLVVACGIIGAVVLAVVLTKLSMKGKDGPPES